MQRTLAQLLERGDNTPELTGDGFSDRLERRISNVFHGNCGVDGCDFDLTASAVLHDHIAGLSRIVMSSFMLTRSFAFGGDEGTNLARVSENNVRAVAHHSG